MGRIETREQALEVVARAQSAQLEEALTEAAEAVRAALSGGIVVASSGAGMGVDAGLPDFRGDEGFWRAYPMLRGRSFEEMASGHGFSEDPEAAWGFYGHRLALYQRTHPHVGHEILGGWVEASGGVSVTSNVDGMWERAGVDSARVLAIHGSISHLQCIRGGQCPVGSGVWEAGAVAIELDEELRAVGALPQCACGELARPNILMFADAAWVARRAQEEAARVERILTAAAEEGRVAVVVEVGAGRTIPTIRRYSERTARELECPLVRVNATAADAAGPSGSISLPLPGAAGLAGIEARL